MKALVGNDKSFPSQASISERSWINRLQQVSMQKKEGADMTLQPIGYTYEADVHCLECAYARFGNTLDDPQTKDSEGNPIHAIFEWDEDAPNEVCGDCFTHLMEQQGIAFQDEPNLDLIMKALGELRPIFDDDECMSRYGPELTALFNAAGIS